MPLPSGAHVRGAVAGKLLVDRYWPGPVTWGREATRARLAGRAVARRLGRVPWRAVGLVVLLAALAALELRTSWLQSHGLATAARHIGYTVDAGPSPSIRFPSTGPHDVRHGYSALPRVLARLAGQGYEVQGQARWSPLAAVLTDAGLHPIYREKSQAGLRVLDHRGRPLYETRFPERVFERFDDVPPVVVRSLLFIENRELLDRASGNPAIEPTRLGKAVLDLALAQVDPGHPVTGGSTLATQLEKVRHSPDGRTSSVVEKGVQMASASLRAHLGGGASRETRRHIVVDYLNALPLGALAGHGEVVGLADGLAAWYGADPDAVCRLLASLDTTPAGDPQLGGRAVAYRQVLSLLLAARRPTEYLATNTAALEARTNAYLRLLAAEGLISPALRDAALAVRLEPRRRVVPPAPAFVDRKAADGARVELLSRLGLATTYELDRLDLTARTSLDAPATEAVTAVLGRLAEPGDARELGLAAPRLLGSGHPARVTYSVTLYERGPFGNHLRVQADTFDGPLNVNEGTRLELGSTAKLRTLVTYLEIVEALHREHAGAAGEARRRVEPPHRDRLTQWAVDYLTRAEEGGLEAMLDAAMRRRYSASPAEAFFTGGGLHRFGNFDAADNGRVMTVREAFERSVNLVFVRLMRDIVDYHVQRLPDAGVLDEPPHPRRDAYLARFADEEGRQFLRRFYRVHREGTTADRLARLATARGVSATRLAVIFRTVRPEARVEELADFLRHHGVARGLPPDKLTALHDRYAPAAWSWQDLGYLAGVHPLELWLVAYLDRHPAATFAEVADASAGVRQDAYRWLFRTKNRRAQDRAIRTLIEAAAFERIHASWARLGYPFASLVPSYATAIGSSGDNPAALSELVGLVVNGGARRPRVRVEGLHFAERTPFETHLGRTRTRSERVLSTAVAGVVARELAGVVQHGTGRRVAGGVTLADGRMLAIGGKTGTGDNRFETVTAAGRSSRVVSRTAAFVFTIGDRFFGSIVAFVSGPEAAKYDFTSSLPVQVFKLLLPSLEPVLAADPEGPVLVAAPRAAALPPGADRRIELPRRARVGLGERREPVDLRRREPVGGGRPREARPGFSGGGRGRHGRA